jgi:hypothetical protein
MDAIQGTEPVSSAERTSAPWQILLLWPDLAMDLSLRSVSTYWQSSSTTTASNPATPVFFHHGHELPTNPTYLKIRQNTVSDDEEAVEEEGAWKLLGVLATQQAVLGSTETKIL